MSTRYSHPPDDGHAGVLLRDHLEDVAERISRFVPASSKTPSGESIREVVETLGFVHDFGKATTYFQQYLGQLPGSPSDKRLRYHAPAGAFAAYYALDARGYDTETCLAGFVAVGKHHGTLPDVMEYVYNRSHRREGVAEGQQTAAEQQQAAIGHQLQDINEHVPELANWVFDRATAESGSWDEFYNGFGELLPEIESAVSNPETGLGVDRDALSPACYSVVLECWGSLVLADKTSAAAAHRNSDPIHSTYAAKRPETDRLRAHINDIEATVSADPDGSRRERLNHFRSRAQSAIVERSASLGKDGGGIATITLPTGMGKTLAGLMAAFTVRDTLDGERVVYALPFTSIIDQVVGETSTIFETDTTGRLLTAHHHLAETTITTGAQADDDEADRHDDLAGMLAESWRAGLTVTTFVQLFESLAGPANTQSMKVPALRDSVIILDEPQSLPLAWWKLVPRLVKMLTERFGATVIAMTATQPQLFETAPELVDTPDTYFQATERVKYQLAPSTTRYIETQEDPISYADASTTLLDDIAADKSTLAICNTIDSARKLTERVGEANPGLLDIGEVYAEFLRESGDPDEISAPELASRIDEQTDHSILHLSTRHRPIDRLLLIEAAKQLTGGGHSLLTISTQLVEAGVDISFDRVYRDLAPIDSIVQAAGRCNRSFERDRGVVTIWWLDTPGDQKRTPAEAVYNRNVSLLPVAAKTLDTVRGDRPNLDESTVARDAVEQYYAALHEEKNVGKASYARYVDEARGDELNDLSLIEQRSAIDVIVCRTNGEWNTVKAIRDAFDRYDFDAVSRLMDSLRTRQISIPVYDSDTREARELSDLPPVYADTEIRAINPSRQAFADFFDASTGFVVPDSTVERRFL